MLGEENGNPLQCSCLENPRDGGAWWAAVYGVAQSWTRLKGLSSNSSSNIVLQFMRYIHYDCNYTNLEVSKQEVQMLQESIKVVGRRVYFKSVNALVGRLCFSLVYPVTYLGNWFPRSSLD